MKTVIIYDSLFGNTKLIAETIAGVFSLPDTEIYHVSKAGQLDFKLFDLLIIGSPTQGGRPKTTTQEFLDKIPTKALEGVKVASFDTRFLSKEQKFFLRLLMKIIDYAAPRIAKDLEKKGGKLIVPPEGFIVVGREGGLREGELEHAKSWARKLIKLV